MSESRKLILWGLIWLTGICFGWLGFMFFGDAAALCNIVYVSKSEVRKLERERVESEKEQGMFFGHTDEAMKLMFELAQGQADNSTKVIFAEEGMIVGNHVSSISKAVHSAVIDKLRQYGS
jgi:hypothetical protein